MSDYEPIYPATERTPKARKRYKCCECLTWIEIGEQHNYISGVCDGDFCQFRWCNDCEEVRKRNDYEDPFEYLWEDVRTVEEMQLYLSILVKRKADPERIARQRDYIEEVKND